MAKKALHFDESTMETATTCCCEKSFPAVDTKFRRALCLLDPRRRMSRVRVSGLECQAYNRIEAARVVRQWPAILERLGDGSLTLTTVSLLARHLTEENHRAVLDSARHLSKREVERMVAALQPRPDVPATVRKLPAPKLPTPPAQTVPATVQDAPIANTLRLACRAHNRHEAEKVFGPRDLFVRERPQRVPFHSPQLGSARREAGAADAGEATRSWQT